MARAARPQAASFEAWRAEFRSYALGQGIRPEVFDAAFAGFASALGCAVSQASATAPIPIAFSARNSRRDKGGLIIA